MAQEDKGLVLRGFLLLAFIGGLVAVVLAILFSRTQPVEPPLASGPVEYVPSVASLVAPGLASFPSGVAWHAVAKLGETLPSGPGRDIRYNAAATLARRGSASVPWALIREMLDEKLQMHNHRVRLADGRDVYDESAARATMMTALRALADWHDKRADKKAPVPAEVREIYNLVDKLTQSRFGELTIQAEKTRATFFRDKL